ncbi:copper chaperone taha [Mycena floridula]|nr:copper chaperone taha [Mycena floridula]
MSDAENSYKLDVKMTCTGCSGAIDRVLKKAKEAGEVTEYSVNLDTQAVIVKGPISLEDLQVKIGKTGKEIRSAERI